MDVFLFAIVAGLVWMGWEALVAPDVDEDEKLGY